MMKAANLTVDGLKITGQLYLPETGSPPYPAVILCHGVPSGISDPADGGYPLLAKTISAAGLAVYTFRFRGTGESEGNFDIAGWTHDLKAVIDYLYAQPEIESSHISLVGFSAGAAVSIYMAAQDKRITSVIACASPADFRAISDAGKPQLTIDHFRKIGIIRDPGYPRSLEEWLNGFRRVNALQSVAAIAPRPLLLVHSRGDGIVPVSDSEKLFARAGEPKKLVIIEGTEHRLRRNETAVATIIQWLKEDSN